jgi:hypothetical protein
VSAYTLPSATAGADPGLNVVETALDQSTSPEDAANARTVLSPIPTYTTPPVADGEDEPTTPRVCANDHASLPVSACHP